MAAQARLSQPSPSSSSSSSSSSISQINPAAQPLRPPPYATLLSGALSGLTSCVLLQPLDLLKTRLQQAHGSHAPFGGKTRRLLRTIEGVVEKDGVKGLWRGTVPTILRNVPGVAAYFYSVTELRRALGSRPVAYLSTANAASSSSSSSSAATPTSTGNLLAGATARVVVGFILCPITVVKARFESSNFAPSENRTLALSLRSIYAEGGVKGLFRGFSATALRDAPYAGLYLMFYEALKVGLAPALGEAGEEGDAKAETTQSRMVAGLCAGTLATFATHPFDIIKTRVQTQRVRQEGAEGASAALLGIRAVLTGAGASTGGARPPLSSLFFDGLGLRCARKALSSAIGWGIFEGGRDLWVKRERQRLARESGNVIVER
ncbi:mitochondrial carrier [Jaminaea rosea]|uniref:Mitochondrial carrier n=1 Tax=Jaminaea rosea TaxID=1569628 RepID=A0A316UIX7_9BASI|nr:mitochondrial carrier [Jaminaea rosea]PWN24818.1 mitochondrial carrier [Jaminaea rosea]